MRNEMKGKTVPELTSNANSLIESMCRRFIVMLMKQLLKHNRRIHFYVIAAIQKCCFLKNATFFSALLVSSPSLSLPPSPRALEKEWRIGERKTIKWKNKSVSGEIGHRSRSCCRSSGYTFHYLGLNVRRGARFHSARSFFCAFLRSLGACMFRLIDVRCVFREALFPAAQSKS